MIADEAVRLGEQAARDLAVGGYCRLGPGLTEAELTHVEHEYGFEFADDHRAFLRAALPLNSPPVAQEGVIHTYARPWPDWRDGDPEELRERLAWPVEGVLFDVEHNRFWDQGWDARPEDLAGALETARRHLLAVPRMVPVYGHRYLPGGRGGYGHAVLSMWQTDIICYGVDLVDYVRNEFGESGLRHQSAESGRTPRVTVPFWRDFV